MTNPGQRRSTCTLVTLAVVVATTAALDASAQVPEPQPPTAMPPAGYPQPAYPQQTYPQQTYPQQGYPQQGYPQPGYPQGAPQPQFPAAPRVNPLRQLFAGTIAALLQGLTGGLATSVTQGVTGGINSWFERKQMRAYAQGAYAPQQAPYVPQQGAYTPQQPAPGYAGGYGSGAYDPATTSTYPPQSSGYDWSNTQVYDPRTGQVSAAQSSGYALASPPAGASVIVAGGAYDVYALRADGSETPVMPATHEFRTGDRFKVYFRPSLPGRLDVKNINPYGRETHIDTVETAAGQLTTLGPYEFAATKGDEALRFVLSPCSSQQLLVATRDIVNAGASASTSYPTPGYPAANNSTYPPATVPAYPPADTSAYPPAVAPTYPPAGAPAGYPPVAATPAYPTPPSGAAAYPPAPQASGLSLGNCSTVATRSIDRVRTRDITKVGVDGTTSFALDPVSQAELASGQLTPREFTVYFRHR
jgi:hypothetical protein